MLHLDENLTVVLKKRILSVELQQLVVSQQKIESVSMLIIKHLHLFLRKMAKYGGHSLLNVRLCCFRLLHFTGIWTVKQNKRICWTLVFPLFSEVLLINHIRYRLSFLCSDNADCRTCEQFGFISHRHVGYHVLVLFLNSGVMEAEERGVGSGGREKAGREKMGGE